MRFILLVIMLETFVLANPNKEALSKCHNINKFSSNQLEIIAYAYNYGKKYDLGLTLAAIAWHESCAGEYRMNFSDPSAGIYHALIPGVMKRYPFLKDTRFNRNVMGELLIRDDEFASKVAIDELLYWKKVRNNNLKNMIKSYNKGFSWEKSAKANELAENYYQNIKIKIDILSKFIPNQLANLKLKNRPPMLGIAKEESNEKTKLIETIKRIEVNTLKDDSSILVDKAKKNNKAVISIYNGNDTDNVVHEKTITLKPFYEQKIK